jgi:hypothetical protein
MRVEPAAAPVAAAAPATSPPVPLSAKVTADVARRHDEVNIDDQWLTWIHLTVNLGTV